MVRLGAVEGAKPFVLPLTLKTALIRFVRVIFSHSETNGEIR